MAPVVAQRVRVSKMIRPEGWVVQQRIGLGRVHERRTLAPSVDTTITADFGGGDNDVTSRTTP